MATEASALPHLPAFAELNEKGDRIEVHFSYSKPAVEAIRRVPGRKFVEKDKGGPFWRLPLDLTSARRLREEFGTGLELGDALKAWGRNTTAQERQLRSLSGAEDAEVPNLRKHLPELANWMRPYQRADAAFMARTNSINANQPGLGKTVETIASFFEAETHEGPQLVIAPKTSLEVVWLAELDRWLPEEVPVFVVSGDDDPEVRKTKVAEFTEIAAEGEQCWLVTNPAMIRFVDNPEYQPETKGSKGDRPQDYGVEVDADVPEFVPAFPELFEIHYNNVAFDEYHKQGVTNPKTKMFMAVQKLQADRKCLISGTPMGGKPRKLWLALHFLEPQQYTSEWRWIDQWLEVEDEETRVGTKKKVHGIKAGREDDFFNTLAPHMVRRTKAEVAPQLPPKQIVDVWYEMTPRQAKQYAAMASDAEVRIEEENLTATGILAEYTRLKQFADAHQRVRNTGSGQLVVKPTTDSGMLPHIKQLLDERGITGDEYEEGDEQVVLASQFSSVVDMVHEWLNEQGVAAVKITGAVSAKQRTEIVREFQGEGGPRVLLITTTAGGVSITLDKASTVIIMDETWNPDDQEQVEDRVHRISRIHRVTVYYLRAKESIEEYIQQVTLDKAVTNREILDLRRAGFRAVKQEQFVKPKAKRRNRSKGRK